MNQNMVTKMDQMVVFRVENSRRRGMYTSSMAANKMLDRVQHPGPLSDKRLMNEISEKKLNSEQLVTISQECLFGFASKKQMRNWISDDSWKQALAEEGLMVAAYEVPKAQVAIGRTQAVFNPQGAKLLSLMCPTKI